MGGTGTPKEFGPAAEGTIAGGKSPTTQLLFLFLDDFIEQLVDDQLSVVQFCSLGVHHPDGPFCANGSKLCAEFTPSDGTSASLVAATDSDAATTGSTYSTSDSDEPNAGSDALYEPCQ